MIIYSKFHTRFSETPIINLSSCTSLHSLTLEVHLRSGCSQFNLDSFSGVLNILASVHQPSLELLTLELYEMRSCAPEIISTVPSCWARLKDLLTLFPMLRSVTIQFRQAKRWEDGIDSEMWIRNQLSSLDSKGLLVFGSY